jgi:hypothetical protein
METALQKALRSGETPEQLKERLGVGFYVHPSLPLVGFKYSQIDSPKADPVVLASRGTVLEKDTWNLVAQPFFRFFNYGEQETDKKFVFPGSSAFAKEDGSLMIVYNYNENWHVNTSGSFGIQECGFSGKTWGQLFWETSKLDKSKLDPKNTYIFELCTVWNKIVRMYPEPKTPLTGVIETATLHDYPNPWVKAVGEELGVGYPALVYFSSIQEVHDCLTQTSAKDPTFEGLVLRDMNGLRVKIKTDTYLALHHMADNGNLGNPKYIVKYLLKGEKDEIITYFPELKAKIEDVEATLNTHKQALLALWEETKGIVAQKDFALAIVGNTPFTGILFNARKTGADPAKIWHESDELIVKVLY